LRPEFPERRAPGLGQGDKHHAAVIGAALALDPTPLLEDPTVSRRHAILIRDEAGVHILDDRSEDGRPRQRRTDSRSSVTR
jgi:hypothetical protein